ncbi:hypothetical protein Fmac_022805 [Flemingia macrophylla]|uniref:Polygalacturonase n=1 Tax=Flemingia macrophylla TaxID=520843 RepID=A0ABD1M0S9_9FABA
MNYGAVGDGLTDDSNLEGKIVAPSSIEEWNGHKDTWIEFNDIDGLTIYGGGKFDGRGSVWWKSCNALFIHNCNKLVLSGTRHVNSAKNHISINSCNTVNVLNITTIAPEDSPNTDGIDISESSLINVEDSTFATGERHCKLPRCTLHVGSLGKDGSYQTVEHIHVYNCTFTGTTNGARIKTWKGGSGYARNISFEHIILVNARNPIIIDQNYSDIENEGRSETDAVEVEWVTYRHVKGTCKSETAITLDCGGKFGCRNICMESVNITAAASESRVRASCINAHGSAASTSPPVSDIQPAPKKIKFED